MPKWDPTSQKKVRDALIVLGTTLPDTSRAFGARGEVDPIQRLISAATTWGGNPRKDAIYLNFTPPKNDGQTVYKLSVNDVPVDGFWSVSLYNGKGYIRRTSTMRTHSTTSLRRRARTVLSIFNLAAAMARLRTASLPCPAGITP